MTNFDNKFQGSPCKTCGNANRYIVTNACVSCTRQWSKDNPEYVKPWQKVNTEPATKHQIEQMDQAEKDIADLREYVDEQAKKDDMKVDDKADEILAKIRGYRLANMSKLERVTDAIRRSDFEPVEDSWMAYDYKMMDQIETFLKSSYPYQIYERDRVSSINEQREFCRDAWFIGQIVNEIYSDRLIYLPLSVIRFPPNDEYGDDGINHHVDQYILARELCGIMDLYDDTKRSAA